jgi:hypothetical protein
MKSSKDQNSNTGNETDEQILHDDTLTQAMKLTNKFSMMIL